MSITLNNKNFISVLDILLYMLVKLEILIHLAY